MSPMRAFLSRLRLDETGAALVEFALALPLFLVLFAATVDGARMLWSYQTAVAGVRDATRYLGRVTAMGTCPSPVLPTGLQAELEAIVRTSAQGTNVTPSGVTVVSVVPVLSCPAGTAGWRNGPVTVGTVTATLQITMPLSGVFALVGGSVGTFSATVTDQTRVFGS